jgi:outer membrane protein assembly factor BamB
METASRRCLASLVWGLTLLCAAVAAAQTPAGPTSKFLTAGRELKQRLHAISEAVSEERYAEAAGALGEFFLDENFEDYFEKPTGQESIKSKAEAMLLALPKAGRESYELQFGAEARKLLKEAVDEGDDGKLTEVIGKYLHTKAGYEAAILWSRRQLDAGRPLAAAVMLDRVLKTSPYLAAYDPEVSLLAAISFRLADKPQEAERILVTLKKNRPGSVEAAGQKITFFDEESQALAWLDKLMGDPPVVNQNEVAEWTMHRGNAARSASAARGSLPITTMRWQKTLGRDEADDEALIRLAKKHLSGNTPAISTLSPLVVNNTVIMRTPERLMGIDANTGKFVWRYPQSKPNAGSDDDNDNAFASSRPPASLPTQRERELSQRVWEDRAYGQVSSDGDFVYLIDDLGYAGMGYVPPIQIGPGGIKRRNPGTPNSYNKLVALNLSKQGKLMWEAGGETGGVETKLAGAFFLGAPLVHGGQLYVMMEVNGELRLAVIEPGTGKLLWSQQLAHIEFVGQQIGSDAMRRLSGATPSLASGILVCPTSASSVVGIDIAQRKLLWGYQYETAQASKVNSFVGYINPPRPIGTYWLDSTAMIVDGKVLLTPTDSDYLICLDLVTGKLIWKQTRRVDPLADMLYIAAVHDGKVVLVGKNRVAALNLADGQPLTKAWAEPLMLESGEMPSGRGYQTGDVYFLPTTKGDLLKIDLAKGEILKRTNVGRTLGNLVAYKDQLISQQYDGVTAFYQSEALREQLAERLKANPEDPIGLAQRAQIELFDGQRDAALATLRKAHHLDPKNDDTRALLVQTLLVSLEKDFAQYEKLAAEVEPLLDQPQQRREFLRLKAQGMEKSGDAVAAFAAYAALAGNEIVERPNSALPTGIENIEPLLRVRFDRYVQSRLQQLHAQAGAEARPAMEERIQAELARAPQQPTTEQLRRIVNYFGWHSAADGARLALAAQRIDAGELIAAEILLSKFAADNSSPIAGRAAALLASIYAKAGRADHAARQYRRLRVHWPDVAVLDKQTGQQLFDEAEHNAAIGPQLAPHTWPLGHVDMTEGGEVVASSGIGYAASQRVYSMNIAEARGALADGSSIQFDYRQRTIILRDRDGAEWNQISLSDRGARLVSQPTLPHAHLFDHLAIFSLGSDIVAVDLLQRDRESVENILWRQEVVAATTDANSPISRLAIKTQSYPYPWAMKRDVATTQADHVVGGVAALGERSVCIMRGREVLCLDPLTGESQWERTMKDPGCELFGDDELLFVVPPQSEEAIVLSVADGRELGKRKVDRIDNRWQTYGRNVLTVHPAGREFSLQLKDAWSEKVLYENKFAFGTRGALIGRDEFAMMQLDGKFVIGSIADGKLRLQTKLEPEDKLLNIHVIRSESQYLVQMETIIDAKDSLAGYVIAPLPGLDVARSVTGRLYAFDRATLKPSWQSPAYISQHGLPMDQPTESPVLVYMRQLNPTRDTPTGARGEAKSSVLVIDRRDGRLLLERDNIRIAQANVYEVVADREENTVTLSLMPGRRFDSSASKSFTFKFTDDPTPPSPPVRTGAMSGLSATEGTDSFFRALGRAINGGAAPDPDEGRIQSPDLPRLNGAPPIPPIPPGLLPRRP